MEENIFESRTLPMLPLRGLNVFPGMLLTFDVERSASVAALAAATDDDQMIFLATQKDLSIDMPEEDDIYHIGTVCRIRQQIRQPRSKICRVMVEGIYKAEAVSMSTEGKYCIADTVRLPFFNIFMINQSNTHCIY